ncbi:hypothetical protein Sme01_49390 [Sphaerisporangium melleum]|uniref:Fungal lipase-type domain-containing protein n=1 Tax=Sphaerisporangium melleum TaxID=321316 RepID=A0A917R3Y0_9ACTN|nr:hypothetical protein GCM10007964_34770 [Sphaerisporangium melleum]GII72463.1 hypothetical protein Sme01_49390 [Sphaerisporangium melleum]
MVSGGRKPETAAGGYPALDWEHRIRDVLRPGGPRSQEVQAPSYEEMRPFGHRETAGFPVYKNLERRLLDATAHPDPEIAHMLAVCAAYSYSDARTLSMIMARMGLEDNHVQMIQTSVDAMLVCSTAYLIQSRSGRVGILVYRGTEPLNFINWLSDIDVDPERIGYQIGDPRATVHAGVYRNVRATRYEVMNMLRRACDRHAIQSPRPDGDGLNHETYGPGPAEGDLEALYITGHSQGGAMAALMGVMIRHERKYRETIGDRLKAVYTYGQPMIGDPAFAAACERDEFLRENVVRYVYDSDIVPSLPPAAAGPFRHFGREYHYRIPHLRNGLIDAVTRQRHSPQAKKGAWEARRRPTQQLPSLLGIPLSAMSFVGRKFAATRSLPVVFSVDDHMPQHYIAALTPPGVHDEYGD